MRHVILGLILLTLTTAHAQNGPMPLEVVKARKGFRMTDRVLFVVDVSGSMLGNLDQAIASTMLIVQTPMDGFQVGLLTFTDTPVRWVGVEHHPHPPGAKHGNHCVHRGWAAMPNDYLKFKKYLTTCSADGGTNVVDAMRIAMRDRTPRLTIVLVSDGEFDHSKLVSLIKGMRHWRKKNKLSPVHIMVWGCGSMGDKLGDVAKEGGGGLWIHGGNKSGPW